MMRLMGSHGHDAQPMSFGFASTNGSSPLLALGGFTIGWRGIRVITDGCLTNDRWASRFRWGCLVPSSQAE